MAGRRTCRRQSAANCHVGINSIASCWLRHSLKEIRSVPSDLHAGDPTSRCPTSQALTTTKK